MDTEKALNYLTDYCQDHDWTEEHSKQRSYSFDEVLMLLEGFEKQRSEAVSEVETLVSGALDKAERLLSSIECADPHVISAPSDADRVILDLYKQGKELVEYLSDH